MFNLYIYPEWIFLHRNGIKICHFEPYFAISLRLQNPTTVVMLVSHWNLHRRLGAQLTRVTEHCIHVGASAILESPAWCDYWQEQDGFDVLNLHECVHTEFIGCVDRLKSRCSGVVALPRDHHWQLQIGAAPD